MTGEMTRVTFSSRRAMSSTPGFEEKAPHTKRAE